MTPQFVISGLFNRMVLIYSRLKGFHIGLLVFFRGGRIFVPCKNLYDAQIVAPLQEVGDSLCFHRNKGRI